MKTLKIFLAVVVSVLLFFSGYLSGIKKNIFEKSPVQNRGLSQNSISAEEKLFFTTDALDDKEVGIKQSLWRQLSNGERQEIKFSFKDDFSKSFTQYFSSFIKEVPSDSPYAFFYSKDFNVPEFSQLMAFNKKTNSIEMVSKNNYESNPYFFSPDYKYVAVVKTATGLQYDRDYSKYSYYVDVIDLKTLQVVLRHISKNSGYVAPNNIHTLSISNWLSADQFQLSIMQSEDKYVFETINILPDGKIPTFSSNAVYISDQPGENDVFVPIGDNNYAPMSSNFLQTFSTSTPKVFFWKNDNPQILVTNTTSPYLFVFHDKFQQSVKKIINKEDWTVVTKDLPNSLLESAEQRRDVFVAPGANFAIAINENTGIVIDLNNLKDVKNFDIPAGYMAYANKNGRLYNSAWTKVDPKTKWLSPTVFNISLYKITPATTLEPSSYVKIDISDVSNSK